MADDDGFEQRRLEREARRAARRAAETGKAVDAPVEATSLKSEQMTRSTSETTSLAIKPDVAAEAESDSFEARQAARAARRKSRMEAEGAAEGSGTDIAVRKSSSREGLDGKAEVRKSTSRDNLFSSPNSTSAVRKSTSRDNLSASPAAVRKSTSREGLQDNTPPAPSVSKSLSRENLLADSGSTNGVRKSGSRDEISSSVLDAKEALRREAERLNSRDGGKSKTDSPAKQSNGFSTSNATKMWETQIASSTARPTSSTTSSSDDAAERERLREERRRQRESMASLAPTATSNNKEKEKSSEAAELERIKEERRKHREIEEADEQTNGTRKEKEELEELNRIKEERRRYLAEEEAAAAAEAASKEAKKSDDQLELEKIRSEKVMKRQSKIFSGDIGAAMKLMREQEEGGEAEPPKKPIEADDELQRLRKERTTKRKSQIFTGLAAGTIDPASVNEEGLPTPKPHEELDEIKRAIEESRLEKEAEAEAERAREERRKKREQEAQEAEVIRLREEGRRQREEEEAALQAKKESSAKTLTDEQIELERAREERRKRREANHSQGSEATTPIKAAADELSDYERAREERRLRREQEAAEAAAAAKVKEDELRAKLEAETAERERAREERRRQREAAAAAATTTTAPAPAASTQAVDKDAEQAERERAREERRRQREKDLEAFSSTKVVEKEKEPLQVRTSRREAPAAAAAAEPANETTPTPTPEASKASNRFSVNVKVEKCFSCSQTVYPVERTPVDDKIFHKNCFKCNECSKTLSLGTYAALGGQYFCKPHFKQLFKLKGNYDEGFGREQHKKKWVEGAEEASSRTVDVDGTDQPAASSEPSPRLGRKPRPNTVFVSESAASELAANVEKQQETRSYASDDSSVGVKEKEVVEHNPYATVKLKKRPQSTYVASDNSETTAAIESIKATATAATSTAATTSSTLDKLTGGAGRRSDSTASSSSPITPASSSLSSQSEDSPFGKKNQIRTRAASAFVTDAMAGGAAALAASREDPATRAATLREQRKTGESGAGRILVVSKAFGTAPAAKAGALFTETHKDTKTAVVEYINLKLSNDVQLRQMKLVPVTLSSLASAVSNGVLFCKLVNTIRPETVDDRAINLTNLDEKRSIENLTLAFNSGMAVGCSFWGVKPEAVQRGEEKAAFNVSWYIINTALRNKIKIEYDNVRERCANCNERLGESYGKRGTDFYCKDCIDDPMKLIQIFSTSGGSGSASEDKGTEARQRPKSTIYG